MILSAAISQGVDMPAVPGELREPKIEKKTPAGCHHALLMSAEMAGGLQHSLDALGPHSDEVPARLVES